MKNEQPHIYTTWFLRTWSEEGCTLRATLKNIETQEEIHFTDKEAFLAFISEYPKSNRNLDNKKPRKPC